MKQTKNTLVLVSVLFMLAVFGFAAAFNFGFVPNGTDIFIFALIMISGVYAFVTHLKRHKDFEQGIPVEDEMSTRIKYKAGHHAFVASLYMWLFIFLFKDLFPDTETMLGGGILLSAVVSIVIKIYLTRHYREDQA